MDGRDGWVVSSGGKWLELRLILPHIVSRFPRAVFAVALLLSGCVAPLTVERLGPQASYARMNRSALSGDRPSESTLTVLRRHGLLDIWDKDPAGGIAGLRRDVVGQPALWPELFALAELSYLHGRKDGSRPDSLAAAIYAYAFLFPDGVASRPSPYDPRFRQACDIYNLALTASFAAPDRGPMRLVSGRHLLPYGMIDIGTNQNQLRWSGRILVSFQPTSNLKIEGVENVYRSPGLGAPLAAMTEAGADVRQGLEIAPRLRVPTNLLLVLDNPRWQLAQPDLRARLVFHTIFDRADAKIGKEAVPLEYDQTAARALSLAEASAWADEYRGFLNGDLFNKSPTRLIALEPHQRGRMPVILVHGTASSPFRWTDMVNDLLEDPAIRDNFEFWFFSYATGNPIPYSALLLRQSIETAVVQLGGIRVDPALGRMTVIGHSQGGLLAKMLVINPSDRLWNGISRRPLDRLKLTDASRALLRETLFPRPLPEVQRVIFVATPQRGSYVAAFSISQLLGQLVTLPSAVTQVSKEVLTGNGSNVVLDPSQTRLGSIYGMSPHSPLIRSLAEIPVTPGVHAHSIIAVQTEGPLAEGSDGVVRYSSAHIDGVDSELVVRSGHTTQSNPATIAEVRRILMLQLAAARPRRPAPVAMLAAH